MSVNPSIATRQVILAAAAALAIAIIAWAFFHPDFRPDPGLISAPVRQELAKLGFKSTAGVRTAEFQYSESEAGYAEEAVTRQTLEAIDPYVTEKRGHRYWKGSTQQSNGLYVGPITVVRFQRTWPPIIGNLLPYEFWTSSRLTELALEKRDGFPDTAGGSMIARLTYEDHYADGRLAESERRRIRCEVQKVVDAASIHTRLSGRAALIECRDSPEPAGRRLSADNPNTYSLEDMRYAHWYVFDRGWSIPIEGEIGMRLNNEPLVRKWKTKLISFEP